MDRSTNFMRIWKNEWGRPVFSHELGSKEFTAKVKELYRDDFIAMQPDNAEE